MIKYGCYLGKTSTARYRGTIRLAVLESKSKHVYVFLQHNKI